MMLHVMFAAMMATGAVDPATVNELRVEPAAEYTEVIVRTSGEVSYSDFLLTEPPRLIIDLKGALHALPRDNFEDINRGGVVRVRTSQFRDDVVRIVVELTAPTSYTLTRQGGEIRVSFPNLAGASFDSWGSGLASIQAEPADSPELAADRRAAEADVPASLGAAARPQEGQPSPFRRQQPLVSQMPRITVTFENTDIRDVLNTFADFTGKSFVPGVGVDGAVTATIKNQPWDLALKAILEARGLTAVETATGIVRVDELSNLQERQAVVQLETQIFKINYAPVDDIAAAMQPALSERGRAIPNPATNSIIVTDVADNLQMARQIVDDLDIRTPQVSISAKIIFVDRSDIAEIGVIWDLKDTQGNQINSTIPGLIDTDNDGILDATTTANQIALTGSSIAAVANASDRVQLPALQLLTTVAIGDFRLFNFIEALSRLDLSDIVAAPTIQTMDNQPAKILVGERTPIRIVDYGAGGAQGQGAQAQFPQSTVRFEETGIKLEVTPHITYDRRIVMDLRAERSGIQLAPGDLGFTFQTQEGTTRLILADGETGVIGGLTVSELTKTVVGVPILMDLPLVGGLFRTTRSDDAKRDLLILVTPHIVDEEMAASS